MSRPSGKDNLKAAFKTWPTCSAVGEPLYLAPGIARIAIWKDPGQEAHLHMLPVRLVNSVAYRWLQGAIRLTEEHVMFMSAPETSVLQML